MTTVVLFVGEQSQRQLSGIVLPLLFIGETSCQLEGQGFVYYDLTEYLLSKQRHLSAKVAIISVKHCVRLVVAQV